MTIKRVIRSVCMEAELTPDELRQAAEEYEQLVSNQTSHAYEIKGYDKNADVYETLYTSDDYNDAVLKLKALVLKHIKQTICRTGTEEPFDWFELQSVSESGNSENETLIYTDGREELPDSL